MTAIMFAVLYAISTAGVTLWIRHLYTIRKRITEENERLSAELHFVAAQFNQLSVRVQEIEERHQSLVRRFRHDCISPLGSIKGFVALLKEFGLGELNQRQRLCVDNIGSSAERLLNLVERVAEPIAFIDSKQATVRRTAQSLTCSQ